MTSAIQRWGVTLAALHAVPVLSAQVSITPRTVVPADLVRFAVQVANATDTEVVAVRVEVPDVLTVLGVDAPAGWTARLIPGTDSTPQAIEWRGGGLAQREFREFAFFARPGADARPQSLVFPVRLSRADGGARDWRPGGYGRAPEVRIEGSVNVTAQGAFALAAAGVGLAVLSLAFALRRRG